MESLWKSSAFTDSDLNVFKWEDDAVQDLPTCTRIYTKASLFRQQNWLEKTQGRVTDEWAAWLDKAAPISTSMEDHFALVISPRPKPPSDEDIHDFPAALTYLSISKASLQNITNKLGLHRALAVLVERGVPVISRIQCTISSRKCQVYTLRVDHTLDHQTAMTITYFPKTVVMQRSQSGSRPQPNLTGSVHAMILGYEQADIDELAKRLTNCKESIFAPFTLIKSFLHVERRRRFREVNHKITQFQSILQNYGRLPVGEEDRLHVQRGGNKQDPKNLIGLYIDVCTLKNELTAWRAQLAGLKSHVNDFAAPTGEQPDIDPEEYLQRLVDEYEVKINKCDLVLQGASLAFQMETAHLSRIDAQNALRDGKQMKAIALLTMVFLPGTFIATLLAVPELESMKSTSQFEPWAWYLILFIPLTVVVLGAYFLWINYYTSKDQKTLASMV